MGRRRSSRRVARWIARRKAALAVASPEDLLARVEAARERAAAALVKLADLESRLAALVARERGEP